MQNEEQLNKGGGGSTDTDATASMQKTSVRDLKVNDATGISAAALVETEGGTAHLTLPSLGQDRSHINGVVIDPDRVRASAIERAARLHPNPPDDMPVVTRVGEGGAQVVTVKDLRAENTGAGLRDARRVALVDETSESHPAKPNALSGATVYATTSIDASITGDDVPRAATGEEDERARLAADFESAAPTPALAAARRLQEEVSGVKIADVVGSKSGGAPTNEAKVDEQSKSNEGDGKTGADQTGGSPNDKVNGGTDAASTGGATRRAAREAKTSDGGTSSASQA